MINGGVYYLHRSFLDETDEKKFSFEEQTLKQRVTEGAMYVCLCDEYFIDIAIPEDYAKAQVDFKERKSDFFDRDGTINVNTGHLYEPEKLQFVPDVPELIRDYKEQGFSLL